MIKAQTLLKENVRHRLTQHLMDNFCVYHLLVLQWCCSALPMCSLQVFKLSYKPSKATDSITTHLKPKEIRGQHVVYENNSDEQIPLKILWLSTTWTWKKKRKKREDSLVGRGCIAKKEHQTVYLIIIK
jgi:hypothetical protein